MLAMAQVPVPVRELHELELLIRAHHPLIALETVEDDRAEMLLRHLADRLAMPYLTWAPGMTLRGPEGGKGIYGTETLAGCLAHIQSSDVEAIYHVRDGMAAFDDPAGVARLKALYRHLHSHRGAILFTGGSFDVPAGLQPLFTVVRLSAPSREEYYQFVTTLLADVRKRMPVTVELDSTQVGQLLHHLQGLTLFEVRKILTQAMVEDRRLAAEDLDRVLAAKCDIVNQSGLLEYYPPDTKLDEIAGLDGLKRWMTSRGAAFRDPDRARAFGLRPPRGLLLVGVQGCGKSLCAKAVAGAWELPLIRLDPARLYNKYMGETERNMIRATTLAERLAPVVLWIDEIEKAFGPNQDQDSGASQRVFGSFLTWMQERKKPVFVIATSNDITRLPPELLRKGRFDEIFFVDLPDTATREQIFSVHLVRSGRSPQDFDLERLAQHSQGFSGAEIEQAIVSGLFRAYEQQREVDTDIVVAELTATVPLSVTMAEPIAALREWARGRTVPAH